MNQRNKNQQFASEFVVQQYNLLSAAHRIKQVHRTRGSVYTTECILHKNVTHIPASYLQPIPSPAMTTREAIGL